MKLSYHKHIFSVWYDDVFDTVWYSVSLQFRYDVACEWKGVASKRSSIFRVAAKSSNSVT